MVKMRENVRMLNLYVRTVPLAAGEDVALLPHHLVGLILCHNFNRGCLRILHLLLLRTLLLCWRQQGLLRGWIRRYGTLEADLEALLIDVEVADVEKCPKLIHVRDAAYIGDGGVTHREQTSAGFLQPAPEEGRERMGKQGCQVGMRPPRSPPRDMCQLPPFL